MLTLKYGVNLVNVSVSCVLCQNARMILRATAACKRVSHCITLILVLLSKLSLTQIQKYQFLLLWNVSVQMWFTSWYLYSILQGHQSVVLPPPPLLFFFFLPVSMWMLCYSCCLVAVLVYGQWSSISSLYFGVYNVVAFIPVLSYCWWCDLATWSSIQYPS